MPCEQQPVSKELTSPCLLPPWRYLQQAMRMTDTVAQQGGAHPASCPEHASCRQWVLLQAGIAPPQMPPGLLHRYQHSSTLVVQAELHKAFITQPGNCRSAVNIQGVSPLRRPVLLAAMRPTFWPGGASRRTVEACPMCWWLPPPWGCSTGFMATPRTCGGQAHMYSGQSWQTADCGLQRG